MKNLTLMVHADVEQALADVLRGLKFLPGFSFTRVEGHGAQDARDPMLSARDRVVGYTPHVRVDMVLEDKNLEQVLQTLRATDCGVVGKGVYWISEVQGHGRL
ncbi:MAG: DUF3240 family protein [Gammaproteobacteria bacterium]|nr:DUF3240 family protein [Gammaproteobacteria bacterium]